MYIKEDLESYKLEYEILASRHKKLMGENKKLKEDIILLKSDKELLENIVSLVESINQETLNKVYESIRKRHILSKVAGI